MRAAKWCLLLFLLLLPLSFAAGPAYHTQHNLLRLHVRAHSNNPADQALKYEVRNTVLAILDPYLQKAENAAAAEEKIAEILPEVVAAAEQTVLAAGYNYPVTASLGTAAFPTRLYGDQVYSAGTYQALQIYLGEGKGENWWRVLFPPLCFIEVQKEGERSEVVVPAVNSAPEEARPQCRSRLLEGLQKLFCKLKTFWQIARYEVKILCD